ncbi:hypothetical protein KX729_29540 [Rhizobium sp. XQZ8]|uniref:hypothetical protein n=1 Tax=Rhizobium populisoli TaxID=2859785 RepID=UPI001CA484B6|nr:hypothetical protein [Rhizobium populisoli]MBW6425554.1 hypothetical protein [Rhizobium populisoli]
MSEADWRDVVRGLKASIDPDRRRLVKSIVREVAGDALPVRLARKRLLLMTVDALKGRPALVAVDGNDVVVVVGLEDLIDLVMEPPPTLGEVMERARQGGVPRDRRQGR